MIFPLNPRGGSLLNYTDIILLCRYVCEQFLLVIAVIFKRGTLDDAEAISKLINGLKQIIGTGNKSMELISCSIMKALLTEYSTTTKSTNFGRSLDFHIKCKKSFEEKDLLHIFMLTVQILQKYMNINISSLSRPELATFVRFLSLAEQILHWEFSNGGPLSLLNFPGSFGDTAQQKTIFRPHKNWEEVLLNPSLLDLFFHLLRVGKCFWAKKVKKRPFCHFTKAKKTVLNFRKFPNIWMGCI